LLSGFHEPLGPRIAGQLGFLGDLMVTVFYGGRFTLDIASWVVGLSIYVRAAVVVGAILYCWWQRPGRTVARSASIGADTSAERTGTRQDGQVPVVSASGP
jgi:hypothetical protein